MDEVKQLMEFTEAINEEHIMQQRPKAYINALREFAKEVPILGPILEAKDAYNDTIESGNLKKAVEILKQKIDELDRNQKIDSKYCCEMQRDLYFISKQYIAASLNQADDDYIDYLSTYVANCLNRDFSDEMLKLSVLNKIAKYSKLHIDILKKVYRDTVTGSQKEYKVNNNRSEVDYCINELLTDGFIRQDLKSGQGITSNPYVVQTSVGAYLLKMLNMDRIK